MNFINLKQNHKSISFKTDIEQKPWAALPMLDGIYSKHFSLHFWPSIYLFLLLNTTVWQKTRYNINWRTNRKSWSIKHTCFRIIGIIFIDKDLVKLYSSCFPHMTSQCSGERKAWHMGIRPLKTWWQGRDTEWSLVRITDQSGMKFFHLLVAKCDTYPVLLWALEER